MTTLIHRVSNIRWEAPCPKTFSHSTDHAWCHECLQVCFVAPKIVATMTEPSETGSHIVKYKGPVDLDTLIDEDSQAPPDGPTLLWRSVANTITLATGAATLSVRAGVGIGKWSLKAGRQATYAIIGLNQSALRTIMTAAGTDMDGVTSMYLLQHDAEGTVERWLASIHYGLTCANVFAAAGFFVAENALSWTSDSSLMGLSFLNSVFGSTETSRAVAAIVSLMKQEYYKPGLDGQLSEISTLNLLTTVASFLFLQRISRRKTEIEWRHTGGDATVFDVVLDDRGFSADVIGTRRQAAVISSSQTVVKSPAPEESADDFALIAGQIDDGVTSNPLVLSMQDQTSLSDEEIRQRIMEQLPAGTKAHITTETMTLKTVRVNIQGDEPANIEAPPGMVLVSEHPNFENSSEGQTIVFRTASKSQSQAEISRNDHIRAGLLENADTDEGGLMLSISPTSKSERTARAVPTEEPYTPAPRPQTLPNSHSDPFLSQGPVANQKRTRKAVMDFPAATSPRTRQKSSIPLPNGYDEKVADGEKPEKPERSGIFKKALNSLSPNPSSAALNRALPGPSRSRSNSGSGFTSALSQTLRPLTSARDSPRRPTNNMPPAQPSTPSMSPLPVNESGRDPQNSSYFTVHERRRESTYSEVDTYSLHSNESRPPSPTMSRTHLRATNSISKTQSSTEISIRPSGSVPVEESSRHHRRSHSFVPSLYSMGTKNTGDEALVLAPKTPLPRKSIFEDNEMLTALARDGIVPGQFPNRHLISTLRRFVRFSTAAYGEYFLKVFGTKQQAEDIHPSKAPVLYHREHSSFAEYTGLPPETIVKSSFVDIKGLKNRYSEGFSPICHFITIDLESKAIVLTCRGTLGLEDLLTDMACDYVDLVWQGQSYKVHRGVRDAARRLFEGSGNADIITVLKASLEEYPEFGLVLVGHSLGGAVAALLAIMLSEPTKHEPGKHNGPSFVTATKPRLLPSEAHSASSSERAPTTLPSGRPIHVYAFGSPAVVSSSLRIATRGLITSVINANDTVPYLSLGTLQDFRAVASRLNEDISGAFNNIKQRASRRVVDALVNYLLPGHSQSRSSTGPPPPSNFAGDGLGEDNWAWRELVEMRKVMTSEKLYPPGEIFTFDNTRVFDRTPDESTSAGAQQSWHYTPLGRPATRVQFKWVRDVETRFNEVRFGSTMFSEHSPSTYESNLNAVERSVCEDTLG